MLTTPLSAATSAKSSVQTSTTSSWLANCVIIDCTTGILKRQGPHLYKRIIIEHTTNNNVQNQINEGMQFSSVYSHDKNEQHIATYHGAVKKTMTGFGTLGDNTMSTYCSVDVINFPPLFASMYKNVETGRFCCCCCCRRRCCDCRWCKWTIFPFWFWKDGNAVVIAGCWL